MEEYYSEKLSAQRLKKCYDIATPRVQQYLKAELDHVRSHLTGDELVLELGCGYCRFLNGLVGHSRKLVGVDTSFESLQFSSKEYSRQFELFQMDAEFLSFDDNLFDVVLCIQNGISAFKVEPIKLIRESLRVTKPEGVCLFSSYAEKFWTDRLEWFRLQSEEGLLGEIDWDATRYGIIICKDGFEATTFDEDDFLKLTKGLNVHTEIYSIDDSSLFCKISKFE